MVLILPQEVFPKARKPPGRENQGQQGAEDDPIHQKRDFQGIPNPLVPMNDEGGRPRADQGDADLVIRVDEGPARPFESLRALSLVEGLGEGMVGVFSIIQGFRLLC